MKAKLPWKKTNAERRAMTNEINRQVIEADTQLYHDITTLTLWALHVHPDTKFGKKRLKRFYMTFDKTHQDLLDYYKLRDEDAVWLCQQKLKEIGVDIDEWEREQKK